MKPELSSLSLRTCAFFQLQIDAGLIIRLVETEDRLAKNTTATATTAVATTPTNTSGASLNTDDTDFNMNVIWSHGIILCIGIAKITVLIGPISQDLQTEGKKVNFSL